MDIAKVCINKSSGHKYITIPRKWEHLQVDDIVVVKKLTESDIINRI